MLWMLALSLAVQAEEPAASRIDRLLDLMRRRLELAPEVARSKWNSGQTIDDPEREAHILESVVAMTPRGLSKAFVESFFRDQIEAGKLIQRQLHAEWRAARAPPFAWVQDVGRELRPQFDSLTPQLLTALSQVFQLRRPDLVASRAGSVLAAFPEDVRGRALETLQGLEDADSRPDRSASFDTEVCPRPVANSQR